MLWCAHSWVWGARVGSGEGLATRWRRSLLGLPGSFPGAPIPLAGGRQGKLPVTAFEAFDLEACTWTRHPSLPSRRAFAGCAMAEGNVFSLGGLQQPGPHNFYSRPHFVNTVEMFDLEHGEQWLAWAVLLLSMGGRGTVCVVGLDPTFPFLQGPGPSCPAACA